MQMNIVKSHEVGGIVSWVVYQKPLDFLGHYVARFFVGAAPTDCYFIDESVDVVRNWIVKEAALLGMGAPHRFERDPADDPVILEMWML